MEPMALPSSCWVLTEDAPPHAIKDASPEWFSLWDLRKDESVGKPISILNNRAGSDLEASSLLMINFKRDGHAKVRACPRQIGSYMYSSLLRNLNLSPPPIFGRCTARTPRPTAPSSATISS